MIEGAIRSPDGLWVVSKDYPNATLAQPAAVKLGELIEAKGFDIVSAKALNRAKGKVQVVIRYKSRNLR